MKNVKYFQVQWTLKSCVSENGHPNNFASFSSYVPKYKNLKTALKHLARYKAKERDQNITHSLTACAPDGYTSGLFQSCIPFNQLEGHPDYKATL